jgi:UPF0716 protein FxsA
MHPVKTIAIAVLAWPVAEIAAFFCVAAAVGFVNAILLVVLTSLAGLLVLRHFSSGSQRLRTGGGGAAAVFSGGMAPVLGGVLMLIPGFLATLLGMLVLLPLSRRFLLGQFLRLFAVRQRPADPDVIDLAPEEWRSLPGEKLPPSGQAARK